MAHKKQRSTLQDIAHRVGVTKMTVSRYLRDPSKVSAKVGAEIERVVKELGYVPSKVSDILSKAKSNSIGILVPSLTNQVFDEVMRGIESIIEPQGYQAMFAHYGYDQDIEEKRIEILLGYNVDGIVLSDSYHTECSKHILRSSGIPIVEIMDSVTPPLQQAVGFDNIKVSMEVTQALLAKGKKRIAYLAARMDSRTKQKIEGYQRAMQEAQLEPVVISTKQASTYSLGSQLLCQVRAEYPGVDAVCCTNDDIAIGALYECLRQGIKVPQQISIVGFHGHNLSSVISPRLATVLTPREEVGRVAAETLMHRINFPNEAIKKKIIQLETQLVAGDTL